MSKILKYLFFFCIIKPYIYLVLGVNVSGAENLPKISKNPAIIVANHNSHIDTMLLMSLFSCSQLLKIHPVAAADYFCNTKLKTFIFKTLFGLIPISRKLHKATKEEIFKEINETLRNGETIIIYPEGTRGIDNTIQEFKSGVAHIAKMNPQIPVIPVFINGPDRILPKGAFLWVPFIADVYIAEPVFYDNSPTKEFTQKIKGIVSNLKAEHQRREEL
ncbi:MAG: 1-acyl-sn-glycerol-3-phosphate acyltransferase [Candidatus Gastranaerophilales bacterium]|nr:1-acyl-sn-glycerol-3-phosphate acyltransferase [Candidatus Gastranaerophilales bacterium]